MADLKRVGVVFEEDGASRLLGTIKSVNASLRENYQSFKLSQSQWDSNTKTAQKLSDRMEFLSNRYDLQKDKVALLSEELKKLNDVENKDITAIKDKEAQLKGAQATLNRYEKDLESVRKEINAGTASIKDMADKFKENGDVLVSTGKKLSVVSAALTAAATVSVKSAMDFEKAFIGVKKTVDGTPEQLKEVEKGIRQMAKEMPTAANRIAEVAETAGQLGVKTDEILTFTETMVKLGETTNLSAEEGASAIARFTNVTGMSIKETDRLVSSLVSLGNNSATTEAEIMSMASRLAGAGSQAKLSEHQILGLSAALSSVGIEAEAGGSAFSKVISSMQVATELGGDSLKDFAKVAGMTAEEFKRSFKEDAASALLAFIDGLAHAEELGTSAIVMLDEMGIKEVRMRDALLKAAGASDLFASSLELSENAWSSNTALSEEYANILNSTSAQLEITKNTLNDLAITVGEILLPRLNTLLENVQKITNWLSNLDPSTQTLIVNLASIVAAIGPLLIFIGKISLGISSILSLGAKLAPIIGPAFAAIKGAVLAVAGALNLPVLAIAAIVAAVAGLVFVVVKHWDEIVTFTRVLVDKIKELFSKLSKWISETISNVVDSFNKYWTVARDWVVGVFESIKNSMSGLFANITKTIETIKNNIIEETTKIVDAVVEKVKKFIDWLLDILNWPIEFIKNLGILVVAIVAMALESLYGLIKPFIDNVIQFFENLKNSILGIVDNIVQKFNDFVSLAMEMIDAFIENTINLFNDFKEIAMNVFTSVKEFFEGILTNIKDFFTNVFNKISEIVTNVANKVKEVWNNSINWIRSSVIQPLVTFFSGIFNSIYSTISNVIEKIKNGFRSVKDFVYTTFENVKEAITTIFSTIGGIIKAPINGVISLINGVIRSLNRIKVPDWVPGLGGAGVNLPQISYLQHGGNLIRGSAIVGEAGAELLTVNGASAQVTPLTSSGGAAQHDLIDYDRMAETFAMVFSKMKLEVGEDGFARMVDNRILEVI